MKLFKFLMGWFYPSRKKASSRKAPDNVTVLDVWTTLDIPVSRVLEGAASADKVIVVSVEDGEFNVATSVANKAEVNWLLDRAKFLLHDSDPR